jgi:hypothetical protein
MHAGIAFFPHTREFQEDLSSDLEVDGSDEEERER